MTGKFKWATEISPAAEWFDLERDAKMGNKVYFGLEPEDEEDESEFGLIRCPKCGDEDVEQLGWIEDEIGGHRPGARKMQCFNCKHVFVVDDED